MSGKVLESICPKQLGVEGRNGERREEEEGCECGDWREGEEEVGAGIARAKREPRAAEEEVAGAAARWEDQVGLRNDGTRGGQQRCNQ